MKTYTPQPGTYWHHLEQLADQAATSHPEHWNTMQEVKKLLQFTIYHDPAEAKKLPRRREWDWSHYLYRSMCRQWRDTTEQLLLALGLTLEALAGPELPEPFDLDDEPDMLADVEPYEDREVS